MEHLGFNFVNFMWFPLFIATSVNQLIGTLSILMGFHTMTSWLVDDGLTSLHGRKKKKLFTNPRLLGTTPWVWRYYWTPKKKKNIIYTYLKHQTSPGIGGKLGLFIYIIFYISGGWLIGVLNYTTVGVFVGSLEGSNPIFDPDDAGMSCCYLVNGIFHPYINRL